MPDGPARTDASPARRALGRYGTVGHRARAVSVGVGWWGGHWLDAKYRRSGHGWLTAGGLRAAATVAGFRQLFVLAAQA